MATLPTSIPGATINPQLITPNPHAYDTTPALNALQTAYQRGILNAETIIEGLHRARQRRLERQKQDEEMQASRSRMEIQPKAAELEAARIQGDLDILPKQVARESAALDADIELIPKKRALASTQLDEAQVDAENRWLDPLGFDDALLKQYVQLFGRRPPLTEAGGYDLEAVEDEISSVMEAAREAALSGESGKGELTGQQRLDAEKARVAAESILTDLREVQRALFKTSPEGEVVRRPTGEAVTTGPNAVGPLAGTLPGKFLANVQALLGSPDRLVKQRVVTMLANSLTLEKTSALKGQISNYEIKFLKESLPGTGDTEEVWDRYLNKAIPILNKVLQATRRALGEGEAPAGQLKLDPNSRVGKQLNAGRPRLVKTQEEYDALRPGDLFQTVSGGTTVYRKK